MKQYAISILVFIAVMVLVVSGATIMGNKADSEGTDVLENAIRRATVQCYALEGAYPESVDYLVENYGLRIDEDKYVVFYDGFASNIMPDITVITKETSDEN